MNEEDFNSVKMVSIDGMHLSIDLITFELDDDGILVLDFVVYGLRPDDVHIIESKKIMTLEFFDELNNVVDNTAIKNAEKGHFKHFGGHRLHDYRIQFYFSPKYNTPASKIKLGI